MLDVVPVEYGQQAFHGSRCVTLSPLLVFPKDAPGVLDGAQDSLLVGIIHNATQLPQNRDSSRRRPIRSGIDRLAAPLHGGFDVFWLYMAPAFPLGLVAVLREALKVFRRKLSGSHTLPSEFLADEWVFGHRAGSLLSFYWI